MGRTGQCSLLPISCWQSVAEPGTHSVGKFYTQLPSQVYLQFIPWILQSRGVFLNSVVEPKVDGVEGAIPTHSGSDALAKQATEPITLLEKLPPRVSQEIKKI